MTSATVSPTPMAERTRTWLTLPEIAAAWGCKVDKILGFVRSGELRAVNIAHDANGERPRFRVSPADFDDFVNRRATSHTPKPTKRKRKRQDAADYARY